MVSNTVPPAPIQMTIVEGGMSKPYMSVAGNDSYPMGVQGEVHFSQSMWDWDTDTVYQYHVVLDERHTHLCTAPCATGGSC